MIPYMRRNLAGKRRTLAAADAIVAVSSTIAADLRERAPEAVGTRLEVIPNPVNTAALRALGASRPAPRAGAYALYVGKLEPNKGAGKLIPALAGAPADLPLVIVGDGALRGQLERQAAEAGRAVQITGWIDRDDVAAWMTHAAFVVFPSHGPESLSRVLLEAGALGVAAAAMDTGGTRDIIADEVTGLLSRNVPELTEDVARLAADAALRRRLGEAARRHVEATFDAAGVVDRIEALYVDLLDRRAARRAE
jgi:glycosyltransferase involved in cell wall biosynthesis